MDQDLIYFPAFSENKNTSTASLFEARKFYKEKTIPYILESINVPFSDLYLENALNGIVDLDGDIVCPIKDANKIKSIGSNSGKGVYVQDFVADAFEGLKEHMKQMVLQAKLPKSTPFSLLKAYTGYISIDDLYNQNIIYFANKFKEYVLKRPTLNSKIINTNTFNKEYIKFIKANLQLAPITKSQTALFYNLRGYSSGMALTIDTADAGSNVIAYTDYLTNEAFACFVDGCIRYGFKLDKNIPWLLVADIESPAWYKVSDSYVGILNRYNISGPKELFKQRFKKVYKEDLESLKFGFYIAYSIFMDNNTNYESPTEKICKREILKRDLISLDQYFVLYDNSYWIKLYTYFKNIETKKSLTQRDFDGIVHEAQTMAKYGMIPQAMEKLNRIFKDYKYVQYYSSLHQNDSVLQDIATTMDVPEIIL
jgi:hypothetical protein